MWKVFLKDGTSFLGKKTFRARWHDDFLDRGYEVVESNNPALPIGALAVVPLSSILYRCKVK